MTRTAVLDTRDRPLADLRISVTDRCNFRCGYCMPKAVYGPDHDYLPRDRVLTYEEIERVARQAVHLGVRKLRLTGGEPLLRREIEKLVARLARIEGIDDLALTTNGAALPRLAPALAAAGLHRITVSLDAIDKETFRAHNDVDFPVERVLEGLDAARAAGLTPIKINTVVQRGKNEAEVARIAQHFRGQSDVIVRYIEFMDVGTTNGWRREDVVTADEILALLAEGGFDLEALSPAQPGEVARRWRDRNTGDEFGIIASVTQPFCGACNRMRLSADGQLFTCLFARTGHDLRTLLHDGVDDAGLLARLEQVWGARADRYSELRTASTSGSEGGPAGADDTDPDNPGGRVEMSYIGG